MDDFDNRKETKEMKKTLKWSMILILLSCWIIPVAIIAYMMQYVTTKKINDQIERTIVTSADRAVGVCEMLMDTSVTISKYASTMPVVRDSYAQFLQDHDVVALRREMNSFIERNYSSVENVLYATVFFTDYPEVQYYTAFGGSTSNDAYKANKAFAAQVKPFVMESYKELNTDIKLFCINEHFYMMRNIMNSQYYPYAVIVMEIDKTAIFDSLKSTWGYTGSRIYVDGEILLDDMEGAQPPDPQYLLQNNRQSRLQKEGGNYFTYVVRKPGRHNIGYMITLDKYAIIDETEAIKYICILLILAMIPLVTIVFIFFNRKVTIPVGTLIEGAHAIEEGKFGYQIEGKGNGGEFAYLTDAFNSMSAKLKHQFETIYSEELALKDARIMALQSQINPHFLNNTLEIINWEARINENYKVSRMIENLSIMLEATMDRRNRRFVTLAEEISYVDAYLFIIAQRLGERLRVVKNVEKEYWNVKVPRLIIQPIIENAVEHGVNGQTHAIITLNIFAKEDKLIIEVRNTGSMSEADEEKIHMLLAEDYEPGDFGSASLGIRNVNRRLKIIYGTTYGLTVKNNKNNETISTIFVKNDQEDRKQNNIC